MADFLLMLVTLCVREFGRANSSASSHARSRAFPPQAVLGPCFSTGSPPPFISIPPSSICHARSRASCPPTEEEARERA